MSYILSHFSLQLFADGGAGGDGGAAGAAPASTDSSFVSSSKAAQNPLATIQYGKPDPTPAAAEGEGATPLDKSAEFEKLIKGDYKEQYNARVSETVKSRLKANQETVDKYNQAAPLLEMIAQKYGVKDASDLAAIQKAMDEDNSFYEDAAMEAGMTVDQYKEVQKMQRENKALRDEMNRQKTAEQAQQIYSRWQEESDAVKQIYPSFDFSAELENPQFQQLLKANIPVQTAFEVLHKDEIIPAAMQYTAKQVETKLTNKIMSGGGRPAEGAIGNASSAVVKTDVSQLTKADRQEIARRVARGEKIRF